MKIEIQGNASGYTLKAEETTQGAIYSVGGWGEQDFSESLVIRVGDATCGRGSKIRFAYLDTGGTLQPTAADRFREVTAKLVVEG